MVVGNEASGDVAVLERDGKSGKLRSTGEKLSVTNPVSLAVTR
jgi:6-phosphogluconolactonase (cycloisomerase 2 family)